MLRPASGLVWLSVAAVAIGTAALWIHPLAWVLAPLTLTALVLVVQDVIHLRRARHSATAQRALPRSVARGVPFVLITRARVSEALPTMRVILRDVGPPGLRTPSSGDTLVWSGPADQEWSRTAQIAVRGLHDFGPLCWEIRGPCQCVAMRWWQQDHQNILSVPEAMISPEAVMKREFGEELILDQMTRSRHRGEGTEFESLNEFRPGDDPRRVDWRATARSAHLILRRYQLEQHRDVVVAVDTGRLMMGDGGRGTKLDCAVESSLMLARSVLKTGDRCGLLVFDHVLRGMLTPRPGYQALAAISTILANLQPTTQESNLLILHETMKIRHPRRCLLVVMSDLIDEETTQRSRAALVAMARQHLVLFVGLRTPELRRARLQVPETGRDVAFHAQILAMEEQRHRAIHGLVRTGVHVLDIEPSALTVPLLNSYQDLRRRNLL